MYIIVIDFFYAIECLCIYIYILSFIEISRKNPSCGLEPESFGFVVQNVSHCTMIVIGYCDLKLAYKLACKVRLRVLSEQVFFFPNNFQMKKN